MIIRGRAGVTQCVGCTNMGEVPRVEEEVQV